jgi:hypothetical protein
MYKSMLILSLMMFTISANAGQHFKTGSATPMPELITELQKVFDKEIKGKDVTSVLVEGHTDQRGSIPYNQELSEQRAKSAVDLLIKMGVDKSKITSVGKGKSQLLTAGTTAEDYATNRRVVVLVKSSIGLATTIISEANKKCEEKVIIKEKIVEKQKIKKHLISVVAHEGIISNESKTYQSGSTIIGEGKIETNYIPAVTYQYQTDNGLVPLIGIDIKGNPKLNFGLGYEF